MRYLPNSEEYMASKDLSTSKQGHFQHWVWDIVTG